jgi:hypothetical protein
MCPEGQEVTSHTYPKNNKKTQKNTKKQPKTTKKKQKNKIFFSKLISFFQTIR